MNEKIKRLFTELQEECAKERITILAAVDSPLTNETVVLVGGHLEIQGLLLLKLLKSMDEQECDCPNCKQECVVQEEPADAKEIEALLEAFLRGELK